MSHTELLQYAILRAKATPRRLPMMAMADPVPMPVPVVIQEAAQPKPALRSNDPFFLVKLLAEVAATYGLTVESLKSQRRFQTFFRARGEFAYRAHMESTASMVRIGNILGGRDHTTVRNAIAQHCITRGLPLPVGINWDWWIARREAQSSTASSTSIGGAVG